MANDPGAFWDQGIWDLSKWDTIAANGGWTEKPDLWISSIILKNTYSVLANGKDDIWASSVRVIDTYSINVIESLDIWDAHIEVHPPDTSFVQEKPDIWNALIYATLHPPIYSAGGGWWFHVWGDRTPDWRSRWKNLNDAYDNWRYILKAKVQSKDDSWGGTVDTYEMDPARIRAQVTAMFGPTTFVDMDEEAIIEELLR